MSDELSDFDLTVPVSMSQMDSHIEQKVMYHFNQFWKQAWNAIKRRLAKWGVIIFSIISPLVNIYLVLVGS